MNTAEWARQKGISDLNVIPAVADYNEPIARSAAEIAQRILILQGTVAVAAGVDSGAVEKWFKSKGLWPSVTQNELTLFVPGEISQEERHNHVWHKEAELALLWVLGLVESLGLPIRECDSRRMVDELMPALGADIHQFVESARLRTPGEILVEDDRHYNLWCSFHQTRRCGEAVPSDLHPRVLFERQYAFEWLKGHDDWDHVQCDA